MQESVVFIRNPIHYIFSLSRERLWNQNKNPKEKPFFIQYPIPVFSIDNIELLRNSSEEYSKIAVSISSIGYYYPFFPNIVEEVINSQMESKETDEMNIFFILYSSISWFLYFNRSSNVQFASSVLTSLISIMKDRYISVSMSMFVYLYRMIIEKLEYKVLKDYVNIIFVFFSSPIRFPNEATSILAFLFGKLMNPYCLNFSDESQSLLLSIVGWINAKSLLFSENSLMQIVSHISSQILNLNIFALNFLKHVVRIVEKDFFIDLIVNLPKMITNRVSESILRINWEILSEEVVTLPRNECMEASMVFGSSITFPNGLVFDKKSDFFSLSSIDFISENLSDIIDVISQVLSNQNYFLTFFLESLIETIKLHVKEEYYGSLLYIFISILMKIDRKDLISISPDLIFNYVIFDPLVTLRNIGKGQHYVQYLRNILIEHLLRIEYEHIDYLLLSWFNYPVFFAEIVSYIIRSIQYVPECHFLKPSIIKALSHVSLFYRSIHLAEANNENIEKARKYLLNLISSIILCTESYDVLLSDQFFFSTLFVLLFESQLRLFVLKHVEICLLNVEKAKIGVIIDCYVQFISSSIPLINDERYPELVQSILGSIMFSYKNRKEISSFLHIVHDQIAFLLSKLINSDLSRTLFFLSLDYFNVLSNEISLTHHHCCCILKSIESIYSTNLSIDLCETLLCLLKGELSSNRNTINSIKQPLLLYVIFDAFKDSVLISRIIEAFADLLNQSLANICICHENGFDRYLLSFPFEKGIDYDQKTLNLISGLYMMISSVKSSPLLVKDFITKLSRSIYESNTKQIKYYIHQIYEFCFEIYSKRQLTHSYIDNPIFSEINNSKQMLNNGISIYGWVMLTKFEKNQVQNTIIELFWDKYYLDILLNIEGYLEIHINNNYIIKSEYVIKAYTWSLICVDLLAKGNECEIGVRLSNIDPIKKRIDANFVDSDITKIVLGGKKTCIGLEIGNFAISDVLSYFDYAQRQKDSPINTLENKIDYFWSFSPHQIIRNSIEFSQSSFGFIMIKIWKLDLLLPLFEIMNLKSSEDQLYLFHLTFSVFSKAILSSEESERMFTETKKLNHIICMISRKSYPYISYKFYCQVFSLFQSVSFLSLKYYIFESFLINLGIWSLASSNDQLSILKHWSKVLFPCSKPFCATEQIYQKLITDLALYYWYSDSDTLVFGNHLSDKPRAQNLDINSCRLEFYKVLTYISSIRFLNTDLIYALEIFREISFDALQTENYLFFIELLIQSIHNNNYIVSLKSNQLLSLFYLVKKNNEDITYRVFRVIAFISRASIVEKDELVYFFNSIIQSLNILYLSEEFFMRIINDFNHSFPEFLGLCCWYAINGGRWTQKIIEKSLGCQIPSFDFANNQHWYLYPLILSTFCEPSVQTSIIVFILQCCIKDIQYLFSVIDIIYEFYGYNSSFVKSSVLQKLLSNYNSDRSIFTKSELSVIINTALVFIFNDNKTRINGALGELFSLSPFTHEEYKPEKHFLFNEKSFEELYVFASQYCYNHNRSVSYHLNKEMNWNDADLAFNCIKIITDLGLISLYPISSLICVILNHCSYNIDEILEVLIRYFNSNKVFPSVLLLIPQLKHRKDYFSNYEIFLKESCLIGINQNIFEDSVNHFSDFIKKIIVINGYLLDSSLIQISMGNLVYDSYKNIVQKRTIEQKNWTVLWSSLSSENGPWNNGNAVEENKWKRDSTYCFSYCPFKTKVNKKFCNHKEASDLRDNCQNERDNQDNEGTNSKFSVGVTFESNEKYIFISKCEQITIKRKKKGVFYLSKRGIEIIYYNGKYRFVSNNEVRAFCYRTRNHHPTAIEIFNYDGSSLFLNFPNVSNLLVLDNISRVFSSSFCNVQTIPFLDYFSSLGVTGKWVTGQISNFEYIMLLNFYSGRSFQDQNQYPIFPVVVFDNEATNMQDIELSLYRNLEYPIGAQNPKKLEQLIQEMKENELLFQNNNHLYSSGPINRPTLCLYLIRVEPFTTKHIRIQGGRFDIPERIFSSMNELNESLLKNSNDFRELIPEFFFFPEFLSNDNGFDFGFTGNKMVDSVELPKWSTTPFDYVYNHRKILESQIVTEGLHKWIDLVWGDKQKGIKSKQCFNTFPPALYEDVWENSSEASCFSEKEKNAFLKLIGQIPPQLFRTPHPQRVYVQKKFKDHMIYDSMIKDLQFSLIGENSLILIDSDGQLLTVQFVITKDSFELSYSKQTIAHKYYQNMFNAQKNLKWASSKSSFFVVHSQIENKIVFVSLPSLVSKQIPSTQYGITNLIADGTWFASIGQDSSTKLYSSLNPKVIKYSLQSYRDEVTCSFLSDMYKVHLVGTGDGYITMFSIKSGKTQRIINLMGAKPLNIMVTISWGFIVVATIQNNAKYIHLYTINGQYLNKVKIDYSIDIWCSWNSNGFDYMALVTDTGRILHCEVYYLAFKNLCCQVKVPLVSMGYSSLIGSIILVQKDGSVLFLSC